MQQVFAGVFRHRLRFNLVGPFKSEILIFYLFIIKSEKISSNRLSKCCVKPIITETETPNLKATFHFEIIAESERLLVKLLALIRADVLAALLKSFKYLKISENIFYRQF